MPFPAERTSSLLNSSLVPLVTWISATDFDLYFLSKCLLEKAVIAVLRIGLINRSYVILHLDTNNSLFISPHLNKVKRCFPTFLALIYCFWC